MTYLKTIKRNCGFLAMAAFFSVPIAFGQNHAINFKPGRLSATGTSRGIRSMLPASKDPTAPGNSATSLNRLQMQSPRLKRWRKMPALR